MDAAVGGALVNKTLIENRILVSTLTANNKQCRTREIASPHLLHLQKVIELRVYVVKLTSVVNKSFLQSENNPISL